jgi:hypothetical protein
MLPLVLAATSVAFVDVVNHRLADSPDLHVVDWWADDLDGDGKLESIARICAPDRGFFLVQHGDDVLETPWTIDGRNDCPAPAPRPAFELRHDGFITETINVHHGEDSYRIAVRGNRLVMVGMSASGFDIMREGREDEVNLADYDKLTWETVTSMDEVVSQHDRGVIVLVGETARRKTTLLGGTTMWATRVGDRATGQITLHVHADRAVTVCNRGNDYSQPCTKIELAAGDHDLPLDGYELSVTAGTTTVLARLETIDGDGDYPVAPPF